MHACFISYRHPARAGSLEEKIIHHTVTAIKDHMDFYTRDYEVYFDKDRLIPGYQYDERLATAICKSACMMVIYWPTYLESDYCKKEIYTMLSIERKRSELLGTKLRGSRLFIPIILRGSFSELPEPIRSGCQYLDYTRQATNPNFNIGDDPEISEKLFRIAEYVKSLCALMKSVESQLFEACDTYVFPELPADGPTLPAQPFPGH